LAESAIGYRNFGKKSIGGHFFRHPVVQWFPTWGTLTPWGYKTAKKGMQKMQSQMDTKCCNLQKQARFPHSAAYETQGNKQNVIRKVTRISVSLTLTGCQEQSLH